MVNLHGWLLIWKRCLMFGSYRVQPWPFQWVSKLHVLLKAFVKMPLFPFWLTRTLLQSIMNRTYWTCHQYCFFPIVYFLSFQFFQLSSGKSFRGVEEGFAWVLIWVFLYLPKLISHIHYLAKGIWTHMSKMVFWYGCGRTWPASIPSNTLMNWNV